MRSCNPKVAFASTSVYPLIEPATAPGKRDIQLLLEVEEGKTKAYPGLVSWLAEGLALQEQQ